MLNAIFNLIEINRRNKCDFLNYYICVEKLYCYGSYIRRDKCIYTRIWLYTLDTKWMLDETTKALVQTVTRWTPANFKRNAHYCSVTNSY